MLRTSHSIYFSIDRCCWGHDAWNPWIKIDSWLFNIFNTWWLPNDANSNCFGIVQTLIKRDPFANTKTLRPRPLVSKRFIGRERGIGTRLRGSCWRTSAHRLAMILVIHLLLVADSLQTSKLEMSYAMDFLDLHHQRLCSPMVVHTIFDPQQPHVNCGFSQGWRILQLDHRAHGRSPVGDLPHDLDSCAADVLETILGFRKKSKNHMWIMVGPWCFFGNVLYVSDWIAELSPF